MTLKEAYEKAKADSDYKHLQSCSDFGDFWGFIFSPVDNPDVLMLGGFTTVNKHTGELGAFSPCDDFDLADKAVEIPVEQVLATTAPHPTAKPVRPSVPSRPKLVYA